MSTDTAETPATEADAPPPHTLTGLKFGSATQRWRLDGPAGPGLDLLTAGFVLMGIPVEAIVPGTAYRLNTGALWLPEFAEKIAPAGYVLAQERPRPGAIDITLAADERRAWRRGAYIQGDAGAFTAVARAIDAGLIVTPAGCQRWRITGAGLVLAQWVATTSGLPLAEVLKRWNTTADALTREDDHTPTVAVSLPDRKITTEFIERDREGNLEKVVQTERTLN